MSKAKSAVTGAASGAAAGAALGPWGAAGGAVVGGIAGWLGGSDDSAPSYTPDQQNFQYGLGNSGTYASTQSNQYNYKQAQLAALGADAYNREAPQQALPDRRDFVNSQGQDYLQGADAQGRQQQLAALGGLQNQTGALNDFANRTQGPSAAQAQLQQGVDAASRQQMSMARSQPGGGGASLRNAAFNAAGISGQAGAQAAQLRAQEDQAYRSQQLQALGAAQQGAGMQAGYAGQFRGADQNFAQVQAGQANYNANAQNSYNQQQQQMQMQVGQNNLNSQLQTRQQGDAMTLGALGQAQQYDVLRNQLAAGQAQAGYNYEAAKAQGAGLGSANYNNAQQQSNAETGMMLGAMSSGAQAYAQMSKKSQEPAQAPTSDIRAKEDIKPASVLEALSGAQYSPAQTRSLYERTLAAGSGPAAQMAAAHDRNALYGGGRGFDANQDEFRTPGAAERIGLGKAGDARQERMHQLLALGANDRYHAAQEGQQPSTWGTGDIVPDMRPAQGFTFKYKDPERHGEGEFVGPMTSGLRHLPGVVEQGPDGMEQINAPRLTLANTAAVSEQQRRIDRLEHLAALGGGSPQPPDYGQFAAPDVRPPDYAALDRSPGGQTDRGADRQATLAALSGYGLRGFPMPRLKQPDYAALDHAAGWR